MCGIAGFVLIDPKPAPDAGRVREWIGSMTETMAHRGPDGQGVWCEGPVALGHRRLSIIDLSTGAQPMGDVAGQAMVTFNGEIYNFQDLKPKLQAAGRIFGTHSDTEIILNGYLEQGPACLESFEGMFSFALWDKRTKTLFAARDRFGKKPFYYTLQNGVFAFASELWALEKLPLLQLDVQARPWPAFWPTSMCPRRSASIAKYASSNPAIT